MLPSPRTWQSCSATLETVHSSSDSKRLLYTLGSERSRTFKGNSIWTHSLFKQIGKITLITWYIIMRISSFFSLHLYWFHFFHVVIAFCFSVWFLVFKRFNHFKITLLRLSIIFFFSRWCNIFNYSNQSVIVAISIWSSINSSDACWLSRR